MTLSSGKIEPVLRGFADSISRKLESKVVIVSVLFALLLIVCFKQFGFLAHDDLFFKYGDSSTYHLALASYVNGRFVPGLVYHALSSAGVELHRIWIPLQLIAYLAFAIFAYVFVDKLDTKSTSIEKTICAAIIALFPYIISYFSNKNNSINALCAVTAITLAIISYRNKILIFKYVATTVFLFITVASYQTTVYYFMVFVCAYHLFHEETLRATVRSILPGAAACAIAFGVFLLTYHAVLDSVLAEIVRTNDPAFIKYFGKLRSSFNDLAGLVISAQIYVAIIGRSFALPEPILPLALKVFGAAILVFAYCRWRTSAARGIGAPVSEIRFPKRGLIVFALILLAASLIQFTPVNEQNARFVLAGVGAVWIALFALILVVASPIRLNSASVYEADAVTFGSRYQKQGFLVLALLLLAASPIHLLILDNTQAPRVLMHVAAVWAALFLLVFVGAAPEWRPRFRGAVALFALAMALTTYSLNANIAALYERDLALSKRIVADLSAKVGFDQDKPLAFVGLLRHDAPHFRNTFDYFSISASKFQKEWAMNEVLQEATGQRLARGDADFIADAKTVCGRIDRWDGYYSAIVTPRGSVVCFARTIVKPPAE